MEKIYYYDNKPQSGVWDAMWTTRTIEQELEACDIESPPRDLFLSYIPKEGKTLDAGCGLGKWVIYLKRLGYDIVGIDTNEMAVAKLKDFDQSIQVQVGDVLDIDYPDSSFDAYISMGVVEHSEEGPIPALMEAYRVLKPNGLIFVSTPTENLIRKLIRRPIRNAINAFPRLLTTLRSGWRQSKRNALLTAAMVFTGSILPERIKRFALGRENRYYYFMEYRFSKEELESFLKHSGFEIIETVPHDFYGSKHHAAGLVEDFLFLAAREGVNFQLNPIGKFISRTLDRISPWIVCSSVLCVGKAQKDRGSA